MKLAIELEQRKRTFQSQADPERVRIVERGIAQSRADAVASGALRAGARAPDFELPDQRGELVRLTQVLMRGPAIVVFYRGGWCPYCNLQLRAYQRLLPELRAASVQLIAVSPQTPDASLTTAQKNALEFEVLSDAGCVAARDFGIAYALPDELRALYTEVGHPLPQFHGDEDWTLPVPATYVVGRDGVLRAAYVELDYRQRMEPEEALRIAMAG
jgi:peroxiredoxin